MKEFINVVQFADVLESYRTSHKGAESVLKKLNEGERNFLKELILCSEASRKKETSIWISVIDLMKCLSNNKFPV